MWTFYHHCSFRFLDGLISECFCFSLALFSINHDFYEYIFYNLDRWILRIFKKSTLSRSSSESSFHSCTDDSEYEDTEIEDEYTWRAPPIIIHNILFGRLWCEFQGQADLEHTQSNHRAVLTIKANPWFATETTKTANLFKYSGFIYDGMYIYSLNYI